MFPNFRPEHLPSNSASFSGLSSTTEPESSNAGSSAASEVQNRAGQLAKQTMIEIQDYLDDELDAVSVASYNSSSDSSDDEVEDPTNYLESISLRPADFRARFMSSEGLEKTETKKLLKALRTVDASLFRIETSSLNVKGPVVKPLDAAKSHLAEHYYNKYGVHILPATGLNTEFEKASVLFSQLERHGENAFGLVLSPRMSGGPEQNINYTGHVLPFLVQRQGAEIHIIELNSASPDDGVLASLADHLPTLLAENPSTARCVVCLHQLSPVPVPNIVGGKSGRQVDRHSCHTDAMQILKDALVLHQNTQASEPICQLFPEYLGPTPEGLSYPRRMIGLPSGLLKTAQYPVFVKAMGGPQESAAHREKYTVYPQDSSPVNHFLLVKALRNSVRIAKQHLSTD